MNRRWGWSSSCARAWSWAFAGPGAAALISLVAGCATTGGQVGSSPPEVVPAPAPSPRASSDPGAIAAAIEAGDRAANDGPAADEAALAHYGRAIALADDGLRGGASPSDRGRVSALRDRANVGRARVLVARARGEGRDGQAARRDLDDGAVALAAVGERELSGYGPAKQALAAARAALDAPPAPAREHERENEATPAQLPPTAAPAVEPATYAAGGSKTAPRPAKRAPRNESRPAATPGATRAAALAAPRPSESAPVADGPPDASCGVVPAGVPSLRLKNDRDGTGGSLRGKLAARASAVHVLAICSVGNLELVAPNGFRIESDAPGLSAAKEKIFVTGAAGLQWELPVTPGKLVKFKVIRTEGAPEAYRVTYYLYPR